MKYKQLMIFCLSLVLILGLTSFAMAQAQDEAAQDKEADKSRELLKKMPPPMLEMLNLSEAEAAKATRGKKIKVFVVGLDKLKAFNPGDKAKKVLIDTKEIVYPIYVEGKLKTSISIRRSGGGWKNASIGGAEIHFLEPVRMKHSQANKINVVSYIIVRVPAVYLSFLGYYEKGDLYLIPTHEHPDIKLDVGKGAPAADIFVKLKPLVAQYTKVLEKPKK